MQIITPEYHPSQAATYGGSHHDRLQNTPSYEEAEHYCLVVQPFRAGGFEATLRLVDLQAAADRDIISRQSGVRVEPDERTEESLLVSRQRAKGMVRKRIKDMGANRLCTLTIRQNDDVGYFSPGDWSDAFARFRRSLRRYGYLSDYVAILEPHKKGLERLRERVDGTGAATDDAWDIPLHIHFVTRSDFKMPINLMRKLWAIASGRDGNIDVQFLRVRHESDAAIDKVASYATKYITKGLAEFERFNKKRYWSAGLALLPRGRTWLKSRDLADALHEARERMGMSQEILGGLISRGGIFIFPNGVGAWFNVRPASYANAPPPF